MVLRSQQSVHLTLISMGTTVVLAIRRKLGSTAFEWRFEKLEETTARHIRRT